jgi:cytochrome c-type biogenesis protein CcmH/NrfG
VDTAATSSPDNHHRTSAQRLITRGLLIIFLGACLIEIVRVAVANRFAEDSSVVSFSRARRWDPSNSEYPAQLARLLAANSLRAEPSEVVRLFQEATPLGPRRADSWASLGSALESSGRFSEAVNAYTRALELFPNSPQINWEFANLLVRTGEISKAFAPMRQTMLGDPSLRTGAFDFAWRAGIPS